MAIYKIPYTVEMKGEHIVEADSFDEALLIAKETDIDDKDLTYVSDSYSVEEYMCEVEVDGEFVPVEEDEFDDEDDE